MCCRFSFDWDDIQPRCHVGCQLKKVKCETKELKRKRYTCLSAFKHLTQSVTTRAGSSGSPNKLKFNYNTIKASFLLVNQIPRFLKITNLGHMRSDPIFFCWCVNPALEFLEIIEFLVATLSSTTWNPALTERNQGLLFTHCGEARNCNHAHKYTSQKLYFLCHFHRRRLRTFLLTYSNTLSRLVHRFFTATCFFVSFTLFCVHFVIMCLHGFFLHLYLLIVFTLLPFNISFVSLGWFFISFLLL